MRIVGAVLIAASLVQPIGDLDLSVRGAVQGGRSPALDRVMQVLTDLGRRDVVAGALLAIAAFDGVAGPATARFALAALLGTNLVVETVRFAVNRPRPDGEHKRTNASFPSGHAASAVSLAWVLGRRWKRIAPLFWVLAAGVAWSRVYLDRHFLSDIVGGAAIGLLCTLAVARLRPFRTAPTGTEAARPGPSTPAAARG